MAYRTPVPCELLRDARSSWVVRIQGREYIIPKTRAYYEDDTIFIDEALVRELGIST